ncbi:MAG: PSD1 and planctomycete cytochrome C domain-containing protein [Pirellulales bacterium]
MLVRLSLSLVLLATASLLYAAEDAKIDFGKDIRPLLSENCFHCHGPDEATREADLRLDTAESTLSVIQPGNAQESELILRLFTEDVDERMPPEDSEKHLNDEQRELIKQWVAQGADYQQHWAFVPPAKPKLPKVSNKAWIRNPIDHLVLSQLEQKRMTPSAEADRTTLIRRATLDLTGLPPTGAEIQQFLADTSDNAYEKVIDRLLASQQYGEHQATSWLEVSRYADTDGYQNDRYRYMHVWRDWVIMSLNENKPYDVFLIEQLAGDMLPSASLKQQIATGFCRNHRINSEDGSIPAEWHVENIVDRVDTLGTAILGLTMGCARCHDHKYDPITQKDYYSLFAYFNNVPEWGVGPNNGNSPPFIDVPKSWPNISPEEDKLIEPGPLVLKNARKEAGNGLQRPQAGSKTTLMVMKEMDTPRETYVLQRGQYNMPDKSEKLSPGVPNAFNTVMGDQPANRLELGRWLTNPANPLTARVAVNRYWQQFFGIGIVKTSENFGSQGEMPSHPKLLDYLATRFIELNWDVKAVHKEILMSATYRQSSNVSKELSLLDPENRLLARGPRFRMSAFMLRDQALAVSGTLSDTMYGESAKPYMPPNIWKAISNNKYVQDKGENLYRRSLYTYWRRTIPPPSMMNFNAAAREVCVTRTELTNTPLQALTLMNNKTFVEAARFLAERILTEGGKTKTERLTFGFQLVTARQPTTVELKLLASSLNAFSQKYQSNNVDAEKLLKTGERPRNENIDLSEHAAYTMLASLLLNLDETINKN